MKIKYRIDILAPVHDVFCWMTERDKVRQWLPGLLGSEIVRDTAGHVGTTLRQVYQSRRKRVAMPVEVLVYEPDRRLVVRTKTKKQDSTFDYQVEPMGPATRLTAVIDVHLLGYMKLVGLFVGELIRDRLLKGCREDFGRLKRLCEQG
jgi:uncharacterized protein YndB with AHSA1/START domain